MLLIKETSCKQKIVSFYIYAKDNYVKNHSDFEPLNKNRKTGRQTFFQEVNNLFSLLFIDPNKKKSKLNGGTVQKCIHKMQVFFRNVLTKCEKQLLQLSGQW